ncbi:MAG: leucine-rich repeat protein, partial [Mobilitalea sp.]
ADNTSYSSDLDCLFDKDKKVLIQYPVASKNTSYTIPDTVTTIAGSAFVNANNLISLSLGEKVKIDQLNSLRLQLKSIKEFKVSDKNSSYSAKDGVLFNKQGDTLLFFPIEKGTAYKVPAGTVTIDTYAFLQSKLKYIKLPDSLITINENAFSGCTQLTTITIPKSVTKMNVTDFKYLRTLKSFYMESGSKLYASYLGILYNIERTQIIFVPQAYEKTVLKFPSTLISLSLGSFNLAKVTEITIPKALKELDVYNEYGKCFDKITLAVGNKNFVLYKGSLYNKNLTELFLFKNQKKAEFPNTLENINSSYLKNSKVTEMVIPAKTQIISLINTIYDISNLQKLTIAKDSPYYSMEDGMLLSKDKTVLYDIPRNMTALDIPASVISIADSLNCANRNLKKIIIPKLMTEIPSSFLLNQKYVELIEVDKGNSKFKSIDGILYTKDLTTLIYYPVKKANKSYIMPNNVKFIENSKYIIENSSLESITLSKELNYFDYNLEKSNSLQEIKVNERNVDYRSVDGVLYNKDMTELIAYPYQKKDNSFTIPDSVVTVSGLCYIKSYWIEEYEYTIEAFSNPNLKTLRIGDKVKTLFKTYEDNPIWDFKNLQNIEVSEKNPNYNSKDGALYNKDFTTMYLYPMDGRNSVLTIPSSVKEIREKALDAVVSNKYLKSIIVENENLDFSSDGITLSNLAGNYKYCRLGDMVYHKKRYYD